MALLRAKIGKRMKKTSIEDTPERLRSRIAVDVASGCHIWNGTRNPKGYGRLRVARRYHLTHRIAYELAHGPIPAGLEIDHLCRNHACCNPAHLEPVTHAENVRRGRSGAQCAARTHCPHGHPYSEENTVRKAGARYCLTCKRAADRAYVRRASQRRQAENDANSPSAESASAGKDSA